MLRRLAIYLAGTGIIFIVVSFIANTQATMPEIANKLLLNFGGIGVVFLIIAAVCWLIGKRS
ncbi:hypothetical protein EPA93_42060 [Ktedonosporobacter rubrisoli]|uniref:Uncharacterized protein n=1 Tax=Ktedonosporobacter rubrisoli TaxID=2509675 RepID=A0A4P6K201_KTERU|nr:hypothetical protein [Ktedonosporobacter rubrisoli]QBD82217.1 hypothetical protein EPA93_42060 [Ktedonosporobacter rubrisoli]